jgi:uroporphyrinogen-III synthase
MPATFVNEAVADGLLQRTQRGDRVLLFRAQEARDVVPESLRAAGREVADVAAYKTHLVVDAELPAKAAGADILTFTSSSTVTGFLANVPDAVRVSAGKVVACIGPITAATARDAGLRVDVVARAFTVDGLVRALDSSVSA